MGSHSGLRVDLGFSLDPAMSRITLDELPNSSEPQFSKISHMEMRFKYDNTCNSPCLVTAQSTPCPREGAPFGIPGGSTFTNRAHTLIWKI